VASECGNREDAAAHRIALACRPVSERSHPSAASFRERFLEALLASATDYAIITLDLDGIVTSWNEGACRILGWPVAEIIGHPADVIFTEDDRRRGAPQAEMALALAEGRSADERWHRRRDNSEFWASGELMPLRQPEGAVEGFIKIMRDRTEQRRADEALREAQALNTLILNSSRDCIVVLDLDARIQFVSPGGVASMELTEAAAILRPSSLSLWTEHPHAAAARAVEETKAGRIGRFQGVCPTARGTQKWWDVVVSPLAGTEGSAARLMAVGRDITTQKQAETRLAQSEERLSLALRAATMVGIWDGDLEARLVFGDANFARIYGVDPEVASAGQPLGHYVNSIHPEDAGAVRAEMQRLYESGDEFIHEHRIVRPDGEIRWVLARGRLVRNAAGQAVRFSGASVDITDRRMAEERQRLLMEELAHRVKNTLTVVQAIASQTLRGSGASPEARETLNTRLMALSRAHDLLMQGRWSEANLLALVEETARLHAHGEAGRFQIAGPDIMLGSRAAMALALVLHELATNAVKYGALSVPEGQILVLWETLEVTGEAQLRFRWEEAGGPPVVPPARQGFGTRLIARSFGQSLGAAVRLDYPSTGVTFSLEAPVAALQRT
jgi:PAS domain S-box-containing protein